MMALTGVRGYAGWTGLYLAIKRQGPFSRGTAPCITYSFEDKLPFFKAN